MPPMQSVRFLRFGDIYRCRKCGSEMTRNSVDNHALSRHGAFDVKIKEMPGQ